MSRLKLRMLLQSFFLQNLHISHHPKNILCMEELKKCSSNSGRQWVNSTLFLVGLKIYFDMSVLVGLKLQDKTFATYWSNNKTLYKHRYDNANIYLLHIRVDVLLPSQQDVCYNVLTLFAIKNFYFGIIIKYSNNCQDLS